MCGAFMWVQSDHPPRFIIHLDDTDTDGGQILLDLEIKYAAHPASH